MAADLLNLTKFYGIRFTSKTQIKFITQTLLENLKLQIFAQTWLCISYSQMISSGAVCIYADLQLPTQYSFQERFKNFF